MESWAREHRTEFHEKWILHGAGYETGSAEARESSTVASFGRVYESIEQMNSFPADKGALYTLAAAIFIPAVPMILAEVPLAVLLSGLVKALR